MLEEAARYGIPLTEGDLAIAFEDRRTIVTGVYTRSIEVVPGFVRPWAFEWTVETFGTPELRTAP